jgi:hypothetical protein
VKVGEYVQKFEQVVVTDPKATFNVTATAAGPRIQLRGETSDRKYHDQLIDLLVAMKLYDITNDIRFPGSEPKRPK